MRLRTYHDFVLFTDDLEVDEMGRPTAFTVRVFQSPVGEGEDKKRVEIDYGALREQTHLLAARRLDFAGQVALGRQLAALLLPEYALGLLKRSLDWLAEQPNAGLRLRLRLLDELEPLPWEVMYFQEVPGEPALTDFLALDPRLSIVRHEALAKPADRYRAGDVLRLVVAMATPEPHGVYPTLTGLPEEQQEIKHALTKVPGIQTEYLPNFGPGADAQSEVGAQLDQVQAAIERQPSSVLHFSGHGEFVPRVGREFDSVEGTGYIILADEHNLARQVSGEELAQLIRERGVRLVTLGACETATSDRLNLWSSVAGSLLRNRIPSVVAMQFTIGDDLAATFMGAFYEVLVSGGPLDQAVSQGREAIRRSSGSLDAARRDWCAPVLYSRVPYGEIFPAIKDDDARLEAERLTDQRAHLQLAWWRWMDKGESPGQDLLAYLEESGNTGEMSALDALLLLRAAHDRRAPFARWLDRLREAGGALVGELDEPGAATATHPGEDARKVLGLDAAAVRNRPPDLGAGSWSAVHHPDRPARQTAALALLALEPSPQEGVRRLEASLARSSRWPRRSGGVEPPWPGRWWRRAELRGTLADADPVAARSDAALPPWNRFSIWLWRFRRRLERDGRRIGVLVAGGALGAGVGLGLLRFLIALLGWRALPFVQLALYSYWGALLGLSLCAGRLLADPLRLPPLWRSRSSEEQSQRAGAGVGRAALSVALGTLFSGLGLLALAGINGLQILNRPLVAPLGFLAGLGLSLALAGLPPTERRTPLWPAFWRVALASAVLVLTQLLFNLARDMGEAIAIAWPGSQYQAYYRWIPEHWPQVDQLLPNWPDMLGLVDAALVGLVLVIGIHVGLALAAHRLDNSEPTHT